MKLVKFFITNLQNMLDEIIEMYQQIGKWEEAFELAQARVCYFFELKNTIRLSLCKMSVRLYLLQRKRKHVNSICRIIQT